MSPEIRKFLNDVPVSIEAIGAHLSDIHTYNAFIHSLKTMDAVERRLAIIGEALFKAKKIDPSVTVTQLKKSIKLRHILVHDYNLISSPTIWVIIEKDLPILKKEIESLLASFNSEA